MVYQCFDKKSTDGGMIQNQHPLVSATRELAEEFPKPLIRKFKKRKVHSSFKDNIWDDDLANMQLISKFDKGFQFFCYWYT